MAVRLQMKLGVVAEQDRLPDSPDTVVVVEPSVGSVARSKGHLYLLVTSRASGNRAHEATRLTAETIRNEYYYDESAGIRVCLEKAILTANKRLTHQRDRLGLGHASDASGPIGIGVAVVRGNELYVATVGPAEAYLIRQARLSTLPDPHRDRGLPTSQLEPDVWRGEVSVGDSLVLISPNIMARLGPDELKDAMVTLHPQSAMEHLHHRFAAADGSGSDGAIAFEATEVASTQKQRTLVPVRPAEPLAGAPDRSPIPLADPVAGGVAAVQAGARQAKTAAGNAFERAIRSLQDLLPQRRTTYRRVTSYSARRETQRRAAVALLAFIVVLGGLGVAVFLAGGRERTSDAASSITAGQRALNLARANLARVVGPGIDLVTTDRELAHELLAKALTELANAEEARVPARLITPVREDVVAALDRWYGVVDVSDSVVFGFDPNAAIPIDLGSMTLGPDGRPYVLDKATKAVWRIDIEAARATAVLREGGQAGGVPAAAPKLMTAGGQDLLIVDANNTVWRWRPAADDGRGVLRSIRVLGATEWGDDITAIGTFVRIEEQGLYNFYVIDPSAQQIQGYSPAADGSGFPGNPSGRLATARAVDQMSSLYIDGDIYVCDAGEIVRFSSGNSEGWDATDPGDLLLRKAPHYTHIASASERRAGVLYAFDSANSRVVAFDKATGAFREQYRLVTDTAGWRVLRGMYVIEPVDGPPELYWIGQNAVHRTVLEAADEPSTSPSPAPSGGASPGASAATSPAP